MFQPMPARWLAISSALLALTVSAQTETNRSALQGYQPYSESKPVPWKDANDTVGQIGGWRAYAKEAAQGPASAPRPAASQAKP